MSILASFIAFIFAIDFFTVLDTVDTCKSAIVGAVVRLWIPVDKTIIVDGILWTPIIIVQARATSDTILLTWAIVDATLSCFSAIVQAKWIIITASFAIVILNIT